MKLISRSNLKALSLGMLLLGVPRPAFASMTLIEGSTYLNGAALTVLFWALGLILLLASYRIIDAITPGNLVKELTEKQNVAVAIFVGSLLLGVSIIIAAVLLG